MREIAFLLLLVAVLCSSIGPAFEKRMVRWLESDQVVHVVDGGVD